MSKSRKSESSTQLPRDVKQLLALLLNEIQSPIDPQKLFEQLPFSANCSTEIVQFLKAKDRAQRRQAFIKSEAMWFSKYGWFMARIVGLFGIILFAIAMVIRGALGIDFITFALLGAAGYYALLMTLSNLRYRNRNKKRRKLMSKEARVYQAEVTSIVAALMRKWNLKPEDYPIDQPYTGAGLELREDGHYYICFN